jgi:hypothetical protein
VGESGWTLTVVARVTGQFCPNRIAPAYIGRP